MLKIFNITNLQFKWLQQFLNIDFLKTGIIEVGITSPSIYFIYQKLYILLPLIVLLTCSPIKDYNLVWKDSYFSGNVIKNMLVSIHWLGTCICAYFVLVLPWFSILDTSNTHLSLERLQTSGYVLSPHLHWHLIYLPLKPKLLQFTQFFFLTKFFLLLSLVIQLIDGNMIHGSKHRSKPLSQNLLYRMWYTSSRNKLTWLWLCSVDAACSIITLFVIWKKCIFIFWNMSKQLLDSKMRDKY